jgi:hypothetical protein
MDAETQKAIAESIRLQEEKEKGEGLVSILPLFEKGSMFDHCWKQCSFFLVISFMKLMVSINLDANIERRCRDC